MTKTLCFLMVTLFLTGCFGSNQRPDAESKTASAQSKPGAKDFMRIKTVYGDIVIKFEKEKAPVTVARIQELVENGFYNGIQFHRVIPGFVIQGGDPEGTGSGGSGKKLKAEFSDLKHVPGAVAMARTMQDVNSADSQFYITLGTHPHLDGKYTIFGMVTEGMENAQKIVKGDKILQISLE